jgi:hypothetical protein
MEDSVFKHPSMSFDPYQGSHGSPKRSIKRFLAIAVFLIGLGVFLASRFLGSSSDKSETPVITPTPTEVIFPTDTPAPTPELSPDVSPTPSVKPTQNPLDKTSGLDRSALSIEVKNGSGEVGAASKASDLLKSLGYKVVSIGNADGFSYEGATILLKSQKANYGALLKKDVSPSYTVASISSTLSSSSSADAVFIVGK